MHHDNITGTSRSTPINDLYKRLKIADNLMDDEYATLLAEMSDASVPTNLTRWQPLTFDSVPNLNHHS